MAVSGSMVERRHFAPNCDDETRVIVDYLLLISTDDNGISTRIQTTSLPEDLWLREARLKESTVMLR